MGLYGLLTTSASGMSAQSALLNAVSDNIANVDTVGYKKATTEFSSLVLGDNVGDYQSGSVKVQPAVSIDKQGGTKSTTTATNLAIQGGGFFIVSQGTTTTAPLYLTRAGAFTKDSNGYLVNSAGFTLQGVAYGVAPAANGLGGLQPLKLDSAKLSAQPTTTAKLYVNLNSNDTVQAGAVPSGNASGAAVVNKTSMVTYDNLGSQVTLDVYFTKTAASTWDVAVYNQAEATPASSSGPFPYTGTGRLNATTSLAFDANGALTTPTSLAITVPGGQSIQLDLSQSTQLASNYIPLAASADGSAGSPVSGYDIASDGTVSVVYENGTTVAKYSIPLATVPSADKMSILSGNVFRPNLDSGTPTKSLAGAAGTGTLQSSAVEASTVDLANELTAMIEAQNNYQADSKVFNTGSQLLQVLINLAK
jgi:flagellar hook protein FlgE